MSILKPFATLRGVNMFGRCEPVRATPSQTLPLGAGFPFQGMRQVASYPSPEGRTITTSSSASPASRRWTSTRSARAVGTFLPT